ncbi:hypothetical protein CBUD_1117c [Coxiella burnetii Dugway 5J108-111]|uniref:Uncharacterized protein n=1 Tax=Coxiella burnetii (strain Dugway 5J108-111) TaxID=434922 RepID=B5XHC5_COXBN|nr:hypothetical protein CBUD_1117c [Coxiella burnetii Dugway 5J108-111]
MFNDVASSPYEAKRNTGNKKESIFSLLYKLYKNNLPLKNGAAIEIKK